MTDEELEKYKAENRELCIKTGEHLKRIISEGGYDVCFNCGAKD